MNTTDYVVASIVALSLLIGLIRGFTRELLTLLVWIVSFVAAYLFGEQIGQTLLASDDIILNSLVGSSILIIAVILLGSIINFCIIKILKFTAVGIIDHLFGAALGLMRGLFGVLVLVYFLSPTSIHDEPFWTDSITIPYFVDYSEWLKRVLPKNIVEQLDTLNPLIGS